MWPVVGKVCPSWSSPRMVGIGMLTVTGLLPLRPHTVMAIAD